MNYATRITSRRAHAKALAAAAAVGIAARLGVWSLPTSGPSAEQPPSPPARLPQAGEGSSETAADVTAEPEPAPIDPKLIQYRQTGSIAVAMKAVKPGRRERQATGPGQGRNLTDSVIARS